MKLNKSPNVIISLQVLYMIIKLTMFLFLVKSAFLKKCMDSFFSKNSNSS